jgi:uncharacterized protein with von Willebrand factor type A (vWA) domain
MGCRGSEILCECSINTVQADILMVTDGEIPPPSQEVQDRLKAAHDSMGLEVHGLLVGSDLSPAMEMFATHLHIFKAWDAVKARV